MGKLPGVASPSSWSIARRTGPSGRCSSGCCGREAPRA